MKLYYLSRPTKLEYVWEVRYLEVFKNSGEVPGLCRTCSLPIF